MEPRLLAAMVSSLISQALLLLLLSLPFSATIATHSDLLPSPFSPPPPPPPPSHPFLALLLHLLSSSQIAAAAPFLPRKRKRDDTHEGIRGEEPDGGEEVGVEGAAPPCAAAAVVAPRANPDHFRLCFRMSAATFEWLSGLLDPLLDCRDPGGASLRLPGATRLAIALARLATGSPYPALAARFGVSERAARFCAKHLCRVLCTNFRFWLAFPARADLRPVSAAFQSLTGGLPDCCGALACARFDAPRGSRRPIAAQIVADAGSRILSIAAGFRGDRPDSAVLRCCSLYKEADEGRLLEPGHYLAGGGGYPLLPWLMVPFADPDRGSCEEDFNAVHRLLCRPALRAISSLKDWGALNHLTEEEDAKVAVACIGTCAILHNVLLMREDYSALSDVVKECSVSSEECRENDGSLGIVTDRMAFMVRSTLAVRARAIRDSGHSVPM